MNKTLEFGTQTPILSNHTKITGSTSNRNGPEWAEMDRNEPEWTEMEFSLSSVLEYKVYMKHKTYMKICIKPVFEGLSTVGQI